MKNLDDLSITTEQYDRILQAVDLAKGLGKGKYVRIDNVKYVCDCVIGQLALLEGVGIETMIEWDLYNLSVADLFSDSRIKNGIFPEQYPYSLLVRLQRIWDLSIDDTKAISKMKEFLNEWVVMYPEVK